MRNDFLPIIIDESTDARIAVALQEAGYKIISIQQTQPGTDDIDIIQMAFAEGAYILTEDKDFGDELVYKKSSHNGAMLLRLAGVAIEKKIQLVLTAFAKNRRELLNAFCVVSKNKLRIRRS